VVAAPNGETFEVAVRVVETEPQPLRAKSIDPADGEGILAVPRPSISQQHDSSVNVTSLAVFADCPRKYYLQRYIGWNGRSSSFDPEEDLSEEDLSEEDFLDLSAADLGTAVHQILSGRPGDYPEEAHGLAGVFLESELGAQAAAATRSSREWDFIVDIDGTLVRGTIDLWFENKNGDIVIVDYKTDAIDPGAAEQRAESYAPQLALYGIAVERALGKRPAHAWLHFLRCDTPVKIPLDDRALQRVENLVADLRTAQESLRFDLRVRDRCRSCQFYRNMCPAA
jgi:CRISPR/Cas system-associated exonuclease Cas4 (RecB family)